LADSPGRDDECVSQRAIDGATVVPERHGYGTDRAPSAVGELRRERVEVA
jgi:hypothetical protein